MGQQCSVESSFGGVRMSALFVKLGREHRAVKVDVDLLHRLHQKGVTNLTAAASKLDPRVETVVLSNDEAHESIPSFDVWGLPPSVRNLRCHSSLLQVKILGHNFLGYSRGLTDVDCAALRNVTQVGCGLFRGCCCLQLVPDLLLWEHVSSFGASNMFLDTQVDAAEWVTFFTTTERSGDGAAAPLISSPVAVEASRCLRQRYDQLQSTNPIDEIVEELKIASSRKSTPKPEPEDAPCGRSALPQRHIDPDLDAGEFDWLRQQSDSWILEIDAAVARELAKAPVVPQRERCGTFTDIDEFLFAETMNSHPPKGLTRGEYASL